MSSNAEVLRSVEAMEEMVADKPHVGSRLQTTLCGGQKNWGYIWPAPHCKEKLSQWLLKRNG